jgi:hypothetical protein
MKPRIIIPILVLSILAVSCVSDDEMLTIINPDGSCYREFTREADSAFMAGDTAKSNPFPVDIDSTWEISWTYLIPEIHTNWPVKNWKWDVADTAKKLYVTARHQFQIAEDMNTGFRLKKSHEWHSLNVKYALEKKFRWFYTYYNYREVYPKIKTFSEIPFEKYMTREEAEFWFSGKPDILKGMNGIEVREFTGDLENKVNSWLAHNYWNTEYKVLLDNYDLLKIKTISKKRLEQARDSVFIKNVKKDGDLELKMEKCLDDYFKTTIFSSIKEKGNSPIAKFEKNLDSLGFIAYFNKSFDYKLLMPGKIIQPNNAIVHGDTLIWKLTAYRMVYSDYEISAQSRKANIWAFVISGIIVFFAIGSYFYKTKS